MQAGLPLTPQKALPNTTLLHGDCLEVMPTLPAGSVQMVFADLPYGVLRKNWDVQINLQSLWRSLATLCISRAAIIFSATQPFATDIICSNRKNFRYDLIWAKGHGTGFLNANRMPLRSHESLLCFYRSLPVYCAQKIRGKPWRRPGRKSNHKHGGPCLDLPLSSNGLRHPLSVLPFKSSNRKSMHPTQKPVALLEWLIKTYTNENDTVLDPTAGSGTTAVAALRTGRHSICIEKDKGYYDVMCKRVADERARLEAES